MDGEVKSEREKEVQEEVRELDNSVAALNQLVEDLGPALSVVLSASSPTVSTDEPEKEICPLANEIRSIRYRILTIQVSVRDKLQRLEI